MVPFDIDEKLLSQFLDSESAVLGLRACREGLFIDCDDCRLDCAVVGALVGAGLRALLTRSRETNVSIAAPSPARPSPA